MPPLFPQRPSRATGDLRRQISTFTSQVTDPTNPEMRDWPVRNPWIVPSVVDVGDPCDERHWLTIESDPAVSGAMRGRIAQLLGGGVGLEPGEGDGAEELFEYWQWAAGELPLDSIVSLALVAIFRGWRPFEVVGVNRQWEGRPVFTPISVKDALPWQFSWTVAGDLVYKPGGTANRGYRMNSLPARMKWWTPRSGSLANPYGHPMHRDYLMMDLAYRQLSEVGLIQIKQSQGFLKISEVADLTEAMTAGDAEKVDEVADLLREKIDELASGGILLDAQGMKVDWVALTSALEGWISLFRWFGDQSRTYYSGGNISSMASGSTGSLALGEVQERGGLRLAAIDAKCIQEEFRSGFLRPWSARNASIIAPGAFPGLGMTPQLADVPMSALPKLSFRALNRLKSEDLETLKTLAEIGIVDSAEASGQGREPGEDKPAPIRIDVSHIVENTRLRVLPDDQEGPILDLGKKAPPSPFGVEADPVDGDDDEPTVPGQRE